MPTGRLSTLLAFALLATACGAGTGQDAAGADAPPDTVDDSAPEWSLLDDPMLRAGGHEWIATVAAVGTGLVAAGVDFSAEDADAAVWVSVDGSSWTRVESDVFGGANAQGINGLVAGGPGVVAAGFDAASGDLDAAVWVSADGYDWIRVRDPIFAAEGHQEITSIVATADGFVAGGHTRIGDDADAAVWISDDGITWEGVEVAALGGFGNQRIHALGAWPGGLVAAGSHDVPNQFGLYDHNARVWISEDGRRWESVDDRRLAGPGWQWISSIAHGPDGLVAAGTYILGRPGVDNDTAVWMSADGREWDRVKDPVLDEPGLQSISALISVPGGLVAVGYDTSADGTRIPAVWMSDSGRSWSRVIDAALDVPGHRWINAIALTAAGLVAGGADGSTRTSDPAVWLYGAPAAP